MTILVFAAHPDDEILGCGGTIARMVSEGEDAYAVILGEGISSRYEKLGRKAKDEIQALQRKSRIAGEIIGITETRFHDLPDNRFDSVPLLDIARLIESEIEHLRPRVIFTHHGGDLNIDHVQVFRAVMTAARPLKESPVKEILSFFIPSSTDWAFRSFAPDWRPNVFVDISDTLDTKIRALKNYDSEMRPSPHPRSYKNIQNIAQEWGEVCGITAAEAFELVRAVR